MALLAGSHENKHVCELDRFRNNLLPMLKTFNDYSSPYDEAGLHD
jgi:hypothetical protein